MPAPLSKIARRRKRTGIKTRERDAKQQAKARDFHCCRWPRFDHDTPGHVCIGQLESAHQVAVGMGGDQDGSRTARAELLTVCHWIHQDSPDALERHGRTWEGLTDKHADGPVIFSRKVRNGPSGREGAWEWVEIARERSIGILER